MQGRAGQGSGQADRGAHTNLQRGCQGWAAARLAPRRRGTGARPAQSPAGPQYKQYKQCTRDGTGRAAISTHEQHVSHLASKPASLPRSAAQRPSPPTSTRLGGEGHFLGVAPLVGQALHHQLQQWKKAGCSLRYTGQKRESEWVDSRQHVGRRVERQSQGGKPPTANHTSGQSPVAPACGSHSSHQTQTSGRLAAPWQSWLQAGQTGEAKSRSAAVSAGAGGDWHTAAGQACSQPFSQPCLPTHASSACPLNAAQQSA